MCTELSAPKRACKPIMKATAKSCKLIVCMYVSMYVCIYVTPIMKATAKSCRSIVRTDLCMCVFMSHDVCMFVYECMPVVIYTEAGPSQCQIKQRTLG
jgi:hypothetical protein